MYRNVATEISRDRNGQTESARPKRLRAKWLRTKRLRPNRPDRNVVYPVHLGGTKNQNRGYETQTFQGFTCTDNLNQIFLNIHRNSLE